ncbi:MAG: hypothetical protein GF411_09280 [Candidatus Lokiarchaeota archaeon]|nr:hypothetical protein [Candidatus Lokiarchaeota archaeon]
MTNLTNRYEIQCVVVFGSAAKSGWNYRSDIDLLIVSDDMGSDWYERNLAAQKLSRGKIQSFVVPLDEFRLATQQRRYLIWEALYDGVPIVDNGIFTEAQKLFLEWVAVSYWKLGHCGTGTDRSLYGMIQDEGLVTRHTFPDQDRASSSTVSGRTKLGCPSLSN